MCLLDMYISLSMWIYLSPVLLHFMICVEFAQLGTRLGLFAIGRPDTETPLQIPLQQAALLLGALLADV